MSSTFMPLNSKAVLEVVWSPEGFRMNWLVPVYLHRALKTEWLAALETARLSALERPQPIQTFIFEEVVREFCEEHSGAILESPTEDVDSSVFFLLSDPNEYKRG